MARDSLFNEEVLWTGRSKSVTVPFVWKITAAVSAVMAITTLSFAVVAARTLHAHVGGMIVFAGWCATLALAAWRVPVVWRSGVEYAVTEKHVIWRRGRIRRSIDRAAISYGLIRWNGSDPTMGDLVLVRAVPTGALRRTLSLTLADVEAPDRLWAIVRGVEPSVALGNGDRPLAQRLDAGERVLWSAIPLASGWTPRRATTAAIAGLASIAFVHSVVRAVPSIAKLLRSHSLPPAMAALLVGAVALGSLVLLAVAIGVAYAALVRPQRLVGRTRYFVTDRRVLIRRGNEELHLDRTRIAYVIDAPVRSTSKVLHDVFLVLDGPQARALAPSGAFGESDRESLKPVFAAIVDAETVGEILKKAA